MPEATQARQVHLWGQEGAFYCQEAIPPEGASWDQEGRMEEWGREILNKHFVIHLEVVLLEVVRERL